MQEEGRKKPFLSHPRIKFPNVIANSFFILQWLNIEIWHQVYQDNLQTYLNNMLSKTKFMKINIIKNEKKYS